MGRMPTQAVSDGYLTMMPDVHFRTGSSHSDMLECVEAGTRKVIEMGYADPTRIGVTGHPSTVLPSTRLREPRAGSRGSGWP